MNNPRLIYSSARDRKVPQLLLTLTPKLPAFAFVVLWEDGQYENPEFVADFWEGDDGFVGELQRWKRHNYPRIGGERGFECWMKVGRSFGPGDWHMVNPELPVAPVKP